METKAHTAPRQTYFDEAERQSIRRALLRYIDENNIGAPTLQRLIAGANGISIDQLPLKTLQRFMADTHRSNDLMVRFCHRFVIDQLAADPVTTFGDQFAAFLGVWRDGRDCRPVPSDMAGSFQSYTKAALPPGQIMRVRSSGDPSDMVPFSRIDIRVEPGRIFAVIRETIVNWRALAPGASDDGLPTTPRRDYEGVMIHPHGAMFAMMRNVVTGTPRTYWLDRQAENRVLGYGHESYGWFDVKTLGGSPLHNSPVVVLLPAKDSP
jgi:hypothetical protein